MDFYAWLPVEDHTPPTSDQLGFGIAALDKLVAMKRKVYVHCKNGHGRAPTLVIAYFIKNGKPPEEAEVFVKSKRPTIHLSEAQRSALLDFAKNI